MNLNRCLTLLTSNGVRWRDKLFSSFRTSGYRVIATHRYENASAELINDLLKSVTQLQDRNQAAIGNFWTKYIETPIEVIVWESEQSSSRLSPYPGLRFDRFSATDERTGCFITVSDLETTQIGGVFFWQQLIDHPDVKTDKDLLRYLYLPTLLAKDGKGIFFQERLINRLTTIGLLQEHDEIICIVDKGGWENLESLTAMIEVDLRRNGKPLRKTLLATALVPGPPVRPEHLSQTIQQRKELLLLLEIPTTVLHAEAGVVYEILAPFSLDKYLIGPDNKNVKHIIKEAARIAAIVDSEYFNFANIGIEGHEETWDYWEPTTDSPNNAEMNLVTVLRTDGDTVYWKCPDRNLLNYVGQGTHASLKMILNCCREGLRSFAATEYKQTSEHVGAKWFASRLLGPSAFSPSTYRKS